MSKIIAFTPIYKRREILEIWHLGILRLMRTYDIEPFAIVSTIGDLSWCKKNNVRCIITENSPLGKKHNKGLRALRDTEFDYICQISSDLLLTNKGMDAMLAHDGDPVIGFSKAYFVDTITKRAVLFEKGENHRSMGACRMIHRSVIEKAGWRLWEDDLERNLDHSSERHIDEVTVIDHPYVVGLKSDVQLTPFKRIARGRDVIPIGRALRGLSELEIQKIKAL